MAVNYDAIQLGNQLGTTVSAVTNLSQNSFPQEAQTDLGITGIGNVLMRGDMIISSNALSSTSFYIDHPVYGNVDSSVLNIDGGYSGTGYVYFGTLLGDFPLIDQLGNYLVDYDGTEISTGLGFQGVWLT